jgi:uncharacterized repeat protein (TIGR01451 family)
MHTSKWIRTVLSITLVIQVVLSALVPGGTVVAASELKPPVSDQPISPFNLSVFNPELQSNDFPADSDGASQVAALLADTTLDVSILSSPWATVDSNPSGIDDPNVFVVQAVVTNTGTTPAIDVSLELDYPVVPGKWKLLEGESPLRTIDQLAPNETYYGYWFARYPSEDDTHQYTVKAYVDDVLIVSTSENFYMPDPAKTVTTRSTLSTGNSGITQVSSDTVVGILFEIIVNYDLGSNPQEVIFSPVGNLDFDPSAYRLMATQVRFYNDAGNWQNTVTDRLFFDTLESLANNAEVTYTFLPQKPTPTRLCSYAAVSYASNDKYDQFFCDESKGNIAQITGTLSIDMQKHASAIEIQQGQVVTYTIDYTNTGDLPLTYAWIWDEVDPSIASIRLDSISPTPTISNSNLVAWYLGDIPILDFEGSTGTLTFSVDVDGNGLPLADNTPLVNNAFYGVNPGSLPPERALTSTVTTTLKAPTIAISKSDELESAEPGDLITYTLNITNTGSITATGLVITDVLPADVSYSGSASPDPDNATDQPLVWSSLAPLAPAGGAASITIPVSMNGQIPNGTVLTNTMSVQYQNTAGYHFQPPPAFDTTLVDAPVLSISKSSFPDPVLTGNFITYTLEYANQGPGDASNVVITDAVPESTTYQSCTPVLSCNEDSGVVSWDIGDLGHMSEPLTVTFSVRVDDLLETGTTISNHNYGISSDQTGYVAGAPVTTSVNRDAAIIEGYTFMDSNGNGLYDNDEIPNAGLTLTMTNAIDPVIISDGDGYYRFRVEIPGSGLVVSDLFPDTFRTTPGSVYIEAVLGITQTVNFGYAPTNSNFGVVYGTVFQDDNHNGNQNQGEDGLSGVELSSDQAFPQSLTTNALGQYTLRYVTPVTATISETNPTNYVSTTPDVVETEVITGSSNSSPVDFGDFLGIKIVGQVFDDLNVNGVNDDGEEGVLGSQLSVNTDSFTTGANGEYTLYERLSGTDPVLITETDPADYVSTNAIPGDDMSRVDANTLRINLPISGTVYSDADFGDVMASGVITISGSVWNDNGANGGSLANGFWESGEPGLGGAVISLSSGMTQTTAADGVFQLYAPPDQAITVTESNPISYISTNAIPGNDAIKLDHDTLRIGPLSSGNTSEGNLFGDVISSTVATISGTVFNDANQNGVLDGVEQGLPGITVTLETAAGTPIPVLTDSSGAYQFAVVPSSYVRVTSAGPGGAFYPTTPESLMLRPPAPQVYPDNNFGYSDYAEMALVYGVVFDDQNSNGQQDFGEDGLVGVDITLTNGVITQTTTTGASGLITGTFAFTLTQAGFYTVLEQNPVGYRSTTPDHVVVAVNLGESKFVEFGDTNRSDTASIYGTVFDDLNGNGIQDSDETVLEGVIISVTVAGGTQVLTTTTRAQGIYAYGFEISDARFYTVSEQDPAKPGYRSTTPDSVVITATLGHSYIVDFGDTQNAGFSTVTGIVFDDDDGNGIQGIRELGIPGVLISLSNGITTTTGQFGAYSMATTDTGYLRVSETDPPTYHSTTPNQVIVNVKTTGNVYQVDFGDSANQATTSFYGTVFNDANVNGLWDISSELGLSGVSVTISSSTDPYLTNAWGQYTFLIDAIGAYTVTESNLPGYFSTNAIPGSSEVSKVDNDTLLAEVNTFGTDLGDNLFGDIQASQVITVSGYVWDDNGAGGGVAGDGVWDPTEPALAGAVISLSSGLTDTTGSDGAFQLIAPAGTITVTETNPYAYISTNAIPGTGAVKWDNDTLVISGLVGGSTSSGNFFGDIATCTCPPDQFEEDDTWDQAKSIQVGAAYSQTHDFCDDAVDWLSFSAQAGQVYTITTSAWGQRADTFLALYDIDGETMLAANDDHEDQTDFSSRIVWQAPADGVYFIRVDNRAALDCCDTEYDIWIETPQVTSFSLYLPLVFFNWAAPQNDEPETNFPAGVINHVCPDPYEVDDTWSQADTIQDGEFQTHSFDSNPAVFAADKDLVSFDIASGETVIFTIETLTNTQTLLELYDAQGLALDVTGSTALNWTAANPGQYFLSISPVNQNDFGCSDVAGYDLLMEIQRHQYKIMLPLLMK